MYSKHYRFRFTLIELLVVVAIISILASMLLPAMSRVRDVARTTDCMSHLKQNAMHIQFYLDDYDEYYLVSDTQDSQWGVAWNRQWAVMYLLDNGQWTNSPVYHCTDPFGPIPGTNWWETTNAGKELGEYHFWTNDVTGGKAWIDYKTNDHTDTLGKKISSVTDSTRFVVQKDNDWADVGDTLLANHGTGDNQENLAFLDGHVDTFLAEENRRDPATGGVSDSAGDGPWYNWGH